MRDKGTCEAVCSESRDQGRAIRLGCWARPQYGALRHLGNALVCTIEIVVIVFGLFASVTVPPLQLRLHKLALLAGDHFPIVVGKFSHFKRILPFNFVSNCPSSWSEFIYGCTSSSSSCRC